MNCLINKTISSNLKKGRKLEVIARYVKLKYKVSLDKVAMQKRLQTYGLEYVA